MKLDILAIGAHPDDIELCAGGTLISHIRKGYACGIIDLTGGELGTRGSKELRSEEAQRASAIMDLVARENLGMADGYFKEDKEHKLLIAAAIRHYQPDIVIATAVKDRHPDHGRASSLISDAVFLAGLSKVMTMRDGKNQNAWKVKAVYHGIQDRYIKPDFVIDVTECWEQKMEAIMAYSSQFYNPDSDEPVTAISSKEFLDFLKARAMEYGRPAGFALAEGFTTERFPAVNSLFDLR